MKFFYATTARVPGVKAHCSQIAQMSRSFQKTGLDFELLHPVRAQLPVYDNKSISEWYGFDEEIASMQLPCTDYLSALPPGLHRYIYNWAFLMMVATFNRSLVKYLSSYPDDFILYTRDLRVFVKLAKHFPSQKKIMEFHLLEEVKGKNYDLETKVLETSSGVVVLNSIMKEMLEHRGYDPDKILIEPNAVDLKTFPIGVSKKEARRKLNITEEGKIVSYIGNFHTLGLEKGLDTIVKAIPSVIESYEDVAFYFVGGPMKFAEGYINDLKARNVNDQYYRFFDRQPYQEIYLWLAASDILVMPLPDHPRFKKAISPIKTFEYMTSGRPMIISDLPAFNDYLEHEKNTLLVPPGNIDAFAQSVVRLLRDDELSRKLAENARINVQSNTWDARAERIAQWIETLNS